MAYFLSQESNYIIGVDRTFNLGTCYVTVLVYKNLRVVRAENRKEHPIFLSPVFIHRDADFEAYHSFFAHIKAMLFKQISIKTIEVNLGKEMYIGSDEESALTKAIESVFPSSIRMLCTRHLKDNTEIPCRRRLVFVRRTDAVLLTQYLEKKGLQMQTLQCNSTERMLTSYVTRQNIQLFSLTSTVN